MTTARRTGDSGVIDVGPTFIDEVIINANAASMRIRKASNGSVEQTTRRSSRQQRIGLITSVARINVVNTVNEVMLQGVLVSMRV